MPTISQIRYLVSDPPTPSATPIFDDLYYEAILSFEKNMYSAAAAAARSLAGYFAQKVSVTAGPVKIESSHKCEHYLKIAKQFDDLSKTVVGEDSDGFLLKTTDIASGGLVSGVSISEIQDVESDTDRSISYFCMGLDED